MPSWTLAPAPTIANSRSWGFSKKAIGEPPMKIRLAARETMISELSVKILAISNRFAPEVK